MLGAVICTCMLQCTILLQAGDIVRFYHKEMEAYMVAEGLFDDVLTEDGGILTFL